MKKWPVENIPDSDNLFMRAHRNFFPDGELQHGVFRDHNGGMSADWDKHSTPEETLFRAKNPADNKIIKLNVGSIREIEPLRVEHIPIFENRSHSEVIGEKSTKVRFKLLRIYKWVINL